MAEKPLPDIPLPLPPKQARAIQTFARLTVESRTHLRRLIGHALREELDVAEGRGRRSRLVTSPKGRLYRVLRVDDDERERANLGWQRQRGRWTRRYGRFFCWWTSSECRFQAGELPRLRRRLHDVTVRRRRQALPAVCRRRRGARPQPRLRELHETILAHILIS